MMCQVQGRQWSPGFDYLQRQSDWRETSFRSYNMSLQLEITDDLVCGSFYQDIPEPLREQKGDRQTVIVCRCMSSGLDISAQYKGVERHTGRSDYNSEVVCA